MYLQDGFMYNNTEGKYGNVNWGNCHYILFHEGNLRIRDHFQTIDAKE